MNFLVARLPSITEIALVVLAAWLAAGWLLPAGEERQTTTTAIVSPRDGSSKPDMKLIMGTPLFGEAKTSAVADESKPKVVAQSKLNIRLIGTVVADERSAAVVEMRKGSDQEVFFIGDTMQLGVRLQEVEANAIVVDHGGKLERIELEEGLEALKSESPPALNADQGIHHPRVNRDVSRTMLNRQLENFPKLLTEARVIPRFKDGKADGFIISQIMPGSLYEKVGLQNGDIIRKVNGAEVTGPQQAMEMFQKLQNATAIAVEIERAGSVQVINYNIQ